MGKKLSWEKSLESLSAIQEYMQDFPGVNKKNIVVKRGTEIIFNNCVSVVAGNYNIYFKVDIMWEEAEFDFRENGLYGYYSSTYNIMSYDKNVLTIYSDDIVILII